MSSLRKIIVDEKEYLWKYNFDDYDYQCDSSLIIISTEGKGQLIIHFRTEKWDFGYCPFNKGVEAQYKGERVIINLNQPRFIAELIRYAINHLKVDTLTGTVALDNGIEILHAIGYKFEYEKKWGI